MAKKDYVPRKEGDLVLWLNNYKTKLAVHKAALGLTNAEFDAQNVFIDALVAALNANTQAQQDAQEARAALDAKKTTNVQGIRKQAQNIKTRATYTAAIGEDLGIVGDEQTVDVNNSKPALKLRKVETGYELTFNLQGYFDGVKIYRQRPGQAKQFLATDTASPYIDTEPQVNGTQYTAWFLIADDAVGKESDAAIAQL
jgi:hypothetical protein